MKRPRIYGNETKCRKAIARYIARAEELLDQAEGVRKRAEALAATNPYEALFSQSDWVESLRKWSRGVQRAMSEFLQEQLKEVLPVLAHGLPPPTGKPRHAVFVDNGEEWLRKGLDELQALQQSLGVSRAVSKAAPAPARFEELQASGLIEEKVITDYAKAMVSPRTPKELHDAIGSAKELTEATLRAALERLSEAYDRRDDLPTLMKKWRAAVRKIAPPDPAGEDILDKAQAALANLVTFLAEWRNAYGTGHGRTRYPPNLKPRHARLAADAAESCVRFIVTTMDDLELLPPA